MRGLSTRVSGAALAALLLAACSNASPSTAVSSTSRGAATPTPTGAGSPTRPTPSTASPTTSAASDQAIRTVATGLDVPWGLAFLPDGSALVTLRDDGKVIRISARGTLGPVSGAPPGVVPNGEGGLLGVAVSPRFTSDRQVFFYLTTAADNRVVRMTLDGGSLSAPTAILTGIPNADHHDGGRLAFGPDGYLYVGTGDAGRSGVSQDRGSLGGKILRVTADGRPAPGNPFPGSPVWTLGHRNVEGLAWDASGRMFASEFGQNTWDELNRIEPGRNYGWPDVEGKAARAGFVDPLVQWHTDDASPSGIAVSGGAVYLAALAGRSLWRVALDATDAVGTPQRLLQQYGRLRTVARAPDGRLWVITSNTFRGSPRDGDDRILSLPGDFSG